MPKLVVTSVVRVKEKNELKYSTASLGSSNCRLLCMMYVEVFNFLQIVRDHRIPATRGPEFDCWKAVCSCLQSCSLDAASSSVQSILNLSNMEKSKFSL